MLWKSTASPFIHIFELHWIAFSLSYFLEKLGIDMAQSTWPNCPMQSSALQNRTSGLLGISTVIPGSGTIDKCFQFQSFSRWSLDWNADSTFQGWATLKILLGHRRIPLPFHASKSRYNEIINISWNLPPSEEGNPTSHEDHQEQELRSCSGFFLSTKKLASENPSIHLYISTSPT